MVFAEYGAVFVVGGGADAAQPAFGQRRFEQVGSVHVAAGGFARADQGVDFIDEQQRFGLLRQLFEHGFDAGFKVAAVFGAGQQGAHVERKNGVAGQHFGHLLVFDAVGQPFGQRGFADAGFAHQQRVVFAAAAQNLHQPFHFGFAAD